MSCDHEAGTGSETRLAFLEERVVQLEEELRAIHTSRSWRVTAPLRQAAAWVRRMIQHQKSGAPSQAVLVDLRPIGAWPPDVRSLEKHLVLQGIGVHRPVSIGVFLHIHYPDLAEEMVACLRNIPNVSGIHISTDTEDKRKTLAALFAAEGFAANTDIRVCPNAGWDIGPFLVGFAEEIPRYSLLLRLHSKRSSHIAGTVGDDWRKMLFASLAGSSERVNAIIRSFEDDPGLGLVCPPIVEYYAKCVHFGGNFALMRDLLARRSVSIQAETPIDFPMGSMFWCRPAVLSPWLDSHFSYADFTSMAQDERDSSLAHALERLFFFGCGITGYSWARVQALPVV